MELLAPEQVTNTLDLYIESMELEGFLGFAKPRIKNLKVSFDRKLQILNSSNGCGKTTFISEINIFPIEKTLFETDGYKIVYFRCNGKRYKMESNHKRNFLYDLETGENINDGGTITQHLAIVKQMFGLTPFLWNAAMGGINFTEADKNTRRTWIEAISGIDFNYPFAQYKKITSELNSLKGAAKHLNAQLTTEASKLLRAEEVEELIASKDILSSTVKDILLSRNTNISVSDKVRLEREIATLEATAKETQLAYNRLARFMNPFSNVTSLDSLRDYHNELKSDIAITTKDIEHAIKRLEERSKLLVKLDRGKGVDIEEVKKDLAYFNEARSGARGLLKGNNVNRDLFPYLKDLDLTRELLSNIGLLYNEMITHLTATKNYNDDALVLPFTIEQYREYVINAQVISSDISAKKAKLEQIELNLSELSQQHKVNCPKCSTSFVPNGDLCDKFKGEIDNLIKTIDTLTPKLADLNAYVQSYDEVITRRKYAQDYLVSEVGSKFTWYHGIIAQYIDSDLTLNELSQRLKVDSNTVYNVEIGIDSSAEIARLEAIIKEYDALKDVADVTELDKEVRELETEIANLRVRRKDLEATLAEVTETGKLYQKHIQLLTQLKDSLENLTSKREAYVEVISNVALEAVESDLQVQLANVTKKVNDNEILINLINSLQGMLDSTKEKIEIFKVLDEAFNPSTGIIAEQLIGYVSAFAKQLTVVIGKLWGYPMKILPCSIENKKGMDYKFPFQIGTKPIPDVSKGSKSQVSVINLAVMLCTRISLGLNGLPLFLDEVGGGFDTVHNQKLTEFIRELLANYGCSNVFLVHHDAAVRNSLGPRDTIVFDASQVIVEPGYNQHVELIYYKGAKDEVPLS